MEAMGGKITRKKMLGLTALGSAALMLPFARTASAKDFESSIRYTPYENALKIPEVLAPVRSTDDTDFFEITMKEAEVEIFPGVKTKIWGYNGQFPGPTIVTREDRKVEIRHTNQLSVPTSVHHHGAYVDGDSDGHPNDLIQPGGTKTYYFGNKQCARTQWYHDHSMHITATNVYRGLSGMYIIGDDSEDTLPLPKGEYDVPLVIQDRLFGRDGSLLYPADAAEDNDGLLGDVPVINGVAQPRFEVAARKYRFRVLNGSNARGYRLALSSGRPFTVIASEGGLFEIPVRNVDTLPIAPAERYEIIVDFSEYAVGEKIVLENRDVDSDEATRELMRFDVVRGEQDDSSIPDVLIPPELQYDDTHLPPDPDNVARVREFRFERSNSQFTINGLAFDPNRIDANPREGDTEIWRVYNNSGGWFHPVHIHLINFKILSRNGRPPHPWEEGWKDTVWVGENEDVRVMMRWPKVPVHEEPGDFAYRYVFHCHNLEHEDHDMMAQIGVQEADVVAPEVTADPEGGSYQEAQDVTLNSSDPEATIYYTTDGSRPRPSGDEYRQPIRVEESLALTAMAVDAIGYRGPVVSFDYEIAGSAPEEAQKSELSLEAALSVLAYGETTTLSGKLAANGQSLPGKRVVLLQRPAGAQSFARVPGQPAAGVLTARDGSYRLAGVKPDKNTVYRAKFSGGEEFERSVSVPKKVNVRPVVTNATSTKQMKFGQAKVISGRVSPAHTGTVKVTVKKGAKVVLTKNVRLTDSRYRFVYRPNTPGMYTVRVTMPAHADHLTAISPANKFRVVR